MPNDYFQFKQFTIKQDQCAMKVGTDGVLLGAWTQLLDASRILDIGTGTGLIAIMLAQRSEALVDAIEIDDKACLQAKENVFNCPWYKRIKVHHTSLHDFMTLVINQYDLVVSNPPFHKEAIKPPYTKRRMARHNDLLGYSEILEFSNQLLLEKGRLTLILPSNSEKAARTLATHHSLWCTRVTRITPITGKPVSRVLLEFSKLFKPVSEDTISIESKLRHNYSKEYIELTRDYYLNF